MSERDDQSKGILDKAKKSAAAARAAAPTPAPENSAPGFAGFLGFGSNDQEEPEAEAEAKEEAAQDKLESSGPVAGEHTEEEWNLLKTEGEAFEADGVGYGSVQAITLSVAPSKSSETMAQLVRYATYQRESDARDAKDEEVEAAEFLTNLCNLQGSATYHV